MMHISLHIDGCQYLADLHQALPIAIPLRAQPQQVKCYGAPNLVFQPVKDGNFIGSIEMGSPVNYFNININPHGNGTHTECSGHVYNNHQTMLDLSPVSHQLAQLITVEIATTKYISAKELNQIHWHPAITAVVLRTSPNPESKMTQDYTGTDPCFLDITAIECLNNLGIEHLIVDLPSIDPESDGGALISHKAFWSKGSPSTKTITELAYIPDFISDGLYLLDIQILHIALDASPSRPVMFHLSQSPE